MPSLTHHLKPPLHQMYLHVCLQTKNLAELCTLLIDDIYGELPSVRILRSQRLTPLERSL